MIKTPMTVKGLKDDVARLESACPPSPELLLQHAMLAIERLTDALEHIKQVKGKDAWIFASEVLRVESEA